MYYDPVTPDEGMRNCPNKVPSDQWQILVAFWNSDEGKMQKTGDGAQPSKGVVWIKTQKEIWGACRSESGRAMEQLENLASQQATTSGGSSVPNDDDFDQIFGAERHGYV